MKNQIKMSAVLFKCLFGGFLFSVMFVPVSSIYAQKSDLNQETVKIYKGSPETEEEKLGDHQKAVELAQDGDLIPAHDLIQKAYQEFPDDPKIIADYIVISAWMAKSAEAVKL